MRRQLGIMLFDTNRPVSMEMGQARSILFVRNDAKLGDAIVSSGLIRKLRKYRPEVKISVLTSAGMASLFKDDFGVDQVVHLSKRPSYREIREVAEAVGPVDMVVSLNQDMKMKDIYLLRQLKSQLNVGLDPAVKLVNVNIQQAIRDVHFADKFDHLASMMGIEGPCEPYMVPLHQASLEKVSAFLRQRGIERYALLNPYGSGNERKLNAEKINQIIRTLQADDDELAVVILSAPDSREAIAALPVEYSERVVHFDQSGSIYDAIAAVELAELVISVDTAIVHIATGLGKNQIAIYRDDKDNFANWHPNSAKSKVIISDEDINSFDFTL